MTIENNQIPAARGLHGLDHRRPKVEDGQMAMPQVYIPLKLCPSPSADLDGAFDRVHYVLGALKKTDRQKL